MKNRNITGLLSAILLIAGLAATTLESRTKSDALLGEAKAVLIGRTDADMQTARAKAEEASRLCPDCAGPWLLLSEIYWNIGDRSSDQAQRAKWFAKGEAAGERAMALDPKGAGPLYWKTTNMASAADLKGWSASLWLFPTVLENMDEVNRRDTHYYFGATDRFWVEVLNRIPLFVSDQFGYPPADVAKDLEVEIKREPRFFANYTYVARLYWKMGRKDEALQRLNYVLTHDAGAFPDYRGDNLRHQALAKALWKEWTGKEFPQK